MSNSNNQQIQDAEILRSLQIVSTSWEHDNLTEDDMIGQLEALCKVADSETNFATFAEEAKLTGRERLN